MIVKVEIIKRKQLKHKVESTSFEISVTQVTIYNFFANLSSKAYTIFALTSLEGISFSRLRNLRDRVCN